MRKIFWRYRSQWAKDSVCCCDCCPQTSLMCMVVQHSFNPTNESAVPFHVCASLRASGKSGPGAGSGSGTGTRIRTRKVIDSQLFYFRWKVVLYVILHPWFLWIWSIKHIVSQRTNEQMNFVVTTMFLHVVLQIHKNQFCSVKCVA